ncbi:MAG: hypothetical protein KAQ85_01470 [Thermodesulfovibrionia bacterium]|nr:hypothetical protein [Thermodesulfovibrionia bacterium]
MNTVKVIHQEVEADVEEELNSWCFDSHLWEKMDDDVAHNLECSWCGIKVYSSLDISRFKVPCLENPRIK